VETLSVVTRLDEHRQAFLGQIVDKRLIDEETLDALIWFHLHSHGDFAQFGAQATGHTFRQSDFDCVLVVKLLRDGTPQVAFVTSRDTISCMRKLRDLLRKGSLRTYPDKFA